MASGGRERRTGGLTVVRPAGVLEWTLFAILLPLSLATAWAMPTARPAAAAAILLVGGVVLLASGRPEPTDPPGDRDRVFALIGQLWVATAVLGTLLRPLAWL